MADAAHRGGGLAAARTRAARGLAAARAAGRRRAAARCSGARRALLRDVRAGRWRRSSRPICCPTAATASTLRANGAGWSRCGRDRHHALARRCAARRLRQLLLPALATAQTARRSRSRSIRRPTRPRTTSATFHADRVCFDAVWPEVAGRRPRSGSAPRTTSSSASVELRNHGDRTLDLELMSAFEVTLADPRADEAHPAFSNLFVGAEWQAGAPGAGVRAQAAPGRPSRACTRRTSSPRPSRS